MDDEIENEDGGGDRGDKVCPGLGDQPRHRLISLGKPAVQKVVGWVSSGRRELRGGGIRSKSFTEGSTTAARARPHEKPRAGRRAPQTPSLPSSTGQFYHQ